MLLGSTEGGVVGKAKMVTWQSTTSYSTWSFKTIPRAQHVWPQTKASERAPQLGPN